MDKPEVSVIVPVHNGEKTIGKCLESIYASRYRDFEVIVVDDFSGDSSAAVAEKFPCRLIRLEKHMGVSKARNVGAENGLGKILLFTDADCILQGDAIELAVRTMNEKKVRAVGGTYTKIPYDSENFFSVFQSLFVNYFETKNPDYLASHCFAIDASLFRRLGGFVEGSFIGVAASVEDVELCHRLLKNGQKMLMDSEIQVQHIFNFSMLGSLKNAAKKSMYWTAYSLKNRDVTRSSGCASRELKFSVASLFLELTFIAAYISGGSAGFLAASALLFLLNVIASAGFFAAVYRARGFLFAAKAFVYYVSLFSFAVGVGAAAGMLRFVILRYI